MPSLDRYLLGIVSLALVLGVFSLAAVELRLYAAHFLSKLEQVRPSTAVQATSQNLVLGGVGMHKKDQPQARVALLAHERQQAAQLGQEEPHQLTFSEFLLARPHETTARSILNHELAGPVGDLGTPTC